MHAQLEMHKVDLYKRAKALTNSIGSIDGSSATVVVPVKTTIAPADRTTRVPTTTNAQTTSVGATTVPKWVPTADECLTLVTTSPSTEPATEPAPESTVSVSTEAATTEPVSVSTDAATTEPGYEYEYDDGYDDDYDGDYNYDSFECAFDFWV
jgi:hypothetical protein